MRSKRNISDAETLVSGFWSAAEDTLFDQKSVAAVLRRSQSWCERCRWDGTGPQYLKIGRSVVYRKRDVTDWIAQHRAVRSTSEYLTASR